MAWASFEQLDRVQAASPGRPILRKVTPSTQRSGWPCASREGDAEGLRPQRRPDAERHRHTIALGRTCTSWRSPRRVPPAAPLTENVVYRYDLTFAFPTTPVDEPRHRDRQRLAGLRALRQADVSACHRRTSTSCGSSTPRAGCRTATARTRCRSSAAHLPDGADAAAAPAPAAADGRPDLRRRRRGEHAGHAPDASDVLLGWKETAAAAGIARRTLEPANELPPLMRRETLNEAEFTSEDLDSHLCLASTCACTCSCGRRCCGTRPRCRPSPTWSRRASKASESSRARSVLPKTEQSTIETDIKNLQSFAGGLTDVRRVLANVPSYMICDDHEVTDDWNMTLDICVGMYGNALGRRVIKNGIVAYSLCQHWGNAPEQFAEATASLPGTTLLSLLDKGNASTVRDERGEDRLDRVGAHRRPDQGQGRGVPRPELADLQLHDRRRRAPGDRHRHADLAQLSARRRRGARPALARSVRRADRADPAADRGPRAAGRDLHQRAAGRTDPQRDPSRLDRQPRRRTSPTSTRRGICRRRRSTT